MSEKVIRSQWSERLSDFLDGNNKLCLRIDKQVDIRIDAADRERLLDRIVQEENAMDVKDLVNGLVASNDPHYKNILTVYELDMKSWGMKTMAEPDETKEEKKLRVATAKLEEGLINPVIQIHFRRFNFKTMNEDERNEWKSFCEKFAEFLLLGNTNLHILKAVLESKGILDIGYTFYKNEIIRFNLCKILPVK